MKKHRHQPVENGRYFTRCADCMAVMSRGNVSKMGYPIPSKSGKYRATSSRIAAVLAGPVWEF